MKQNRIMLILALFASGVAVGLAAGRFPLFKGRGDSRIQHALRLPGYRFINPLLECELGREYLEQSDIVPFKHKVETLIAERKKAGLVKDVAVYFRDLQDGPWFGINEEMRYSPASLMKLPVLIGYLKQAEEHPGMLETRTLVWDDNEDWGSAQNIKPRRTIERGKRYTVGTLLYYMLAYSDNNAWHVLFKNIDYTYLDRILDEMNVKYDPDKEEDFMTILSYSSMLRILYNASYLSKPMSEKALELLSHVDLEDGIVAGIPAGVPVASKFGERVYGERNEVKQLHEFGIVYYPNNHYLLGIMTRGNDFGKLKGVLRDISRLVYTEVDRHAQRR